MPLQSSEELWDPLEPNPERKFGAVFIHMLPNMIALVVKREEGEETGYHGSSCMGTE